MTADTKFLDLTEVGEDHFRPAKQARLDVEALSLDGLKSQVFTVINRLFDRHMSKTLNRSLIGNEVRAAAALKDRHVQRLTILSHKVLNVIATGPLGSDELPMKIERVFYNLIHRKEFSVGNVQASRPRAWPPSEVHQVEYHELKRRPYRKFTTRTEILKGSEVQLYNVDIARSLEQPYIFHVSIGIDECQKLLQQAEKLLGIPSRQTKSPYKQLRKLLRNQLRNRHDEFFATSRLPKRTVDDVKEFSRDLLQRQQETNSLYILEKDDRDHRYTNIRMSRLSSLLLAREVAGQAGLFKSTKYMNFSETRAIYDDDLQLRGQWNGCAGDVMTIRWVSNTSFVCGTTTHSDPHNQEYNKGTNLILGSASVGQLRAYPDHRIVRPVVRQGANSTETMRNSQSPWMFCSVVSSAYDARHDRCYTSSFDRTVKIWRAAEDGLTMRCLGTWLHRHNVNFVAVSAHNSSMVATCEDAADEAVRVYNVGNDDDDSISDSPYSTYSLTRTDDLGLVPGPHQSDKWAWLPATIQWGQAPTVSHLLLVGYSPRSFTGDDNDIPESKRDSGEICLWDCLEKRRLRINTATTSNVFEVLWHPSQPSFVVATSPCGLDVPDGVRTQIRIFTPASVGESAYAPGAYSEFQTLQCTALDINELSIMPNSFTFSYITAACTDGSVYIWDTAFPEKPLHVLQHGDPIDRPIGEIEREDVGVKFTAWGDAPGRFYTGASDGLVKVWNIQAPEPFVRNLLEVPAAITSGAFSPDLTRLLIGDASGGVHLLSLKDDGPFVQEHVERLPTGELYTRFVPMGIPQHDELPPPNSDSRSAADIAHEMLERNQLVLHPNRTIGAIQGLHYDETGLVCLDLHQDEDASKHLQAEWESKQQANLKMHSLPQRFNEYRPVHMSLEALKIHSKNLALDFQHQLQLETKQSLAEEKAEIELQFVDANFLYEVEFPSNL